LIRKTPQKPGERKQAFDRSEWREVSWDEALDYVADRMVEIYQRDGARAMAAYLCAKATNEDNYLLQKMMRTQFRTNNTDHCTRLCHAASVVALQMAVGSSAMSNTAAEVIKSDVFILTGTNTTENHPDHCFANESCHREIWGKTDRGRSRAALKWSIGPSYGCRKNLAPMCRLFSHGACHPQRKTLQPGFYRRSHRKFRCICRFDGKVYARICRNDLRRGPPLIVEAARMYATAKNAPSTGHWASQSILMAPPMPSV
jgi:hypothetical protein